MSLQFSNPFNVRVNTGSDKQADGAVVVQTQLERRKNPRGKHTLSFSITPWWLQRLHEFRSTPVLIPTVKREGKMRFMDVIPTSRPVVLFVERHELNYFLALINGRRNYFIVSLPANWKRQGCRSVRQLMKALAESHEFYQIFKHYIAMDDDIVGGAKSVSKDQLVEVSLEELFITLESYQDRAPLICFQPQRNKKYSKRHWKPCKITRNTSVAEKLILFNTDQTRHVHYFPAALLDVLEHSVTSSGPVKFNLEAFPCTLKAFRQGEDFGLCIQLGKLHRACMLQRYFLTEQNVQSRNGTQKANEKKELHQLLFMLNNTIESSIVSDINLIDFASILSNLEKKFESKECNNIMHLQTPPINPSTYNTPVYSGNNNPPIYVNTNFGNTTFAAIKSLGQRPVGWQFKPLAGNCTNEIITFCSWNGNNTKVIDQRGNIRYISNGVILERVK